MIQVTSKGGFEKTMKSLKRLGDNSIFSQLDSYGQRGVAALASMTPTDSGRTANSWRYVIKKTANSYTIEWHNDNVNQGANIAILIQYGHATGTGGYVQGIDYINPAIRGVFESMSQEITRALRA